MAFTRLTLTFAAASASMDLAAIGAALAARLGVDVQAMVFVERTLLRLAELQQLRRVRLPSGESEAVSPAELALEFELQGERLRAAVEAAAREAGIAWSFESVADEAAETEVPFAGVIAMASANGLLGHRRDLVRRLFRRVHGLILLPASGGVIRRSAILVPERPAGRFLDDALEFARRVRGELPVDVLAAEGADAEARLALDRHGMVGLIHPLPTPVDLSTLPTRLPAAIDSLIVAAADFPEHDSPLGRLLEGVHRPVLLLRALAD
ncbi:MAG: hypothetical protein JNK67_26870 [Alphaproteobacteria bacterium]|nr:hypothetical protein [Alphaproteobacteria bacterium]